jgi:16S rRNA (uracil1498-N3)-methyltransferase
MAAPWIYVGGNSLELRAGQSGRAELDAQELRHATGAKRLRHGDAVVLFDGRGVVADATLTQRGDAADYAAPRMVAPPRPHLTLATALPKGDRSAVLVDMATQLGASSFVPLRCVRSVVTATPSVTTRLRRVAVEACKQSRRPHLPSFGAECTPAQAVAAARAAQAIVLLLDPRGASIAPLRSSWGGETRLVALVGPEGGFDDAELEEATALGAVAVSLGTGVLRVETAAVAVTQAVMGG